jgi:dihydrofolate reductase
VAEHRGADRGVNDEATRQRGDQAMRNDAQPDRLIASSPDRLGPRVILIAAVADNGVIGRDGKMPWHLSDDLKRFKRLTIGHRIVMGRKTWASIGGRPLPGRENVVLSRQSELRLPGALVVPTLDAALHGASGDVFVIGGADVYAQAMARADAMELTLVHQSPEGDVKFPGFDAREWVETAREPHDGHTFVTLERRARAATGTA